MELIIKRIYVIKEKITEEFRRFFYSERKNRLANRALCLIGILSFLYTIFFSDFAEMHISISFLDFPIFIGEIVLAVCIVLFIKYWRLSSIQLQRWHYLLLAYIIFVLIKAFHGYFKWGPLAFRNAAMFYYLLFAVISYYLFDVTLLRRRCIYFTLLSILAILIAFRLFRGYYIYTCIILALVLTLGIDDKRLKYTSILLLFIILPYMRLITVSRALMLAEASALLLLFAYLLYRLKLKLRYKAIFIMSISLISIVIAYVVVDEAGKTHIRSLLTPGMALKGYRNALRLVEAKKDSFKPRDILPADDRRALELKEAKEGRRDILPVRLYDRNRDVGIRWERYREVDAQEYEMVHEELEKAAKQHRVVVKQVKEIFGQADIPSEGYAATPIKEIKSVLEEIETVAKGPEPIIKEHQVEVFKEFKESIEQVEVVLEEPEITFKEHKAAFKQLKTTVEKVEETIEQVETPEIVAEEPEAASETTEQIEEQRAKSEEQRVEEPQQIETAITTTEKPEEIKTDRSYQTALFKRLKEPIKQLKVLVEQADEAVEEFESAKLGVEQREAEDLKAIRTYGNNIVWRMLLWRDMFKEFIESKRFIFGLDFGKPFRSKSIWILRWDRSWSYRVGWQEPHNFYLHILYRAGAIGLLFIAVVWGLFINMTRLFIKRDDIKGILLSSILLYWLVAINFAVILELPYLAIPFWSLFGMVLKYNNFSRQQNI